jgi:hypothetical protein
MDRRRVLQALAGLAGLSAWPLSACAESFAEPPCCGEVSDDGTRLRRFLDGTDVERLWLPGFKVDWQSGAAIAAWPAGTGAHTHCSAFVASMAKRLGIYVLRPPEHRQTLLANAQVAWLRSQPEGPGNWWNLRADVNEAQYQANRGLLVLAGVENPNPAKAGHIAIVRPGAMQADALATTGPMVTQVGGHNALSMPLAHGFRGHRGAWQAGGGGTVQFFAHHIDWTRRG